MKRIRLTNSQLCVLIELGLDRQISQQPTHRPAFTDTDLDELLAKLPTRYNWVCSNLRRKIARLRYSK